MSKEPPSSESDKIMEQINSKPESKTIDLVVDHKLNGVTPEMIDWWWDNIDTTERYKLWHPKDHKSFVWEIPPKEGHIGSIHRVDEDIGGITTTLRIRGEDLSISPISVEFDHAIAASVLDDNDNPTSWLLHEYESIEIGTKLRSTFRLPARAPKQFIEALRKHNIEEIGEFVNFLPKLYKESKNST
ncbi:MAG: DAPG hydrolase family protein [Candidatus Thorarchaeota archaeon]